MKKLIYGSLFLALVGIGFSGCKKEEINKNELSNQTTIGESITKASSSNPYDYVGRQMYSLLEYLDDYQSDFTDTNVFCPIEFAQSQQKIYSTETKFVNRLKEFASDNNLAILSDSELSEIYNMFLTGNPQSDLNKLVLDNKVSETFEQLLLGFNFALIRDDSPREYIKTALLAEEIISKNISKLSHHERELLFSIVSGVKYTAQYMEDNNLEVFPLAAGPGVPCGASIGFYSASFVGLCMAAGPIGWGVAIIGFAGGVYGVVDNC